MRRNPLISTVCAICRADTHDRELYAATFDDHYLPVDIFSARRLPDGIHYRIVQCRKCGLIRSNPILGDEDLSEFYAQSRFTYAQEALYAARTYLGYFHRYVGGTAKDAMILEVGCGNGTFLKALCDQGFQHVYGVEPSREAVAQARDSSGRIHKGMFAKGIYPAKTFDVICGFQMFDHLADPHRFLKDCRYYLKPKGTLVLIMHNIASWPARLLGRRCPMIDIEHPFLYNRATIRTILEQNRFNVKTSFAVHNTYPLWYWFQLLPLSSRAKIRIWQWLKASRSGQIPMRMNMGNMGVVARIK